MKTDLHRGSEWREAPSTELEGHFFHGGDGSMGCCCALSTFRVVTELFLLGERKIILTNLG